MKKFPSIEQFRNVIRQVCTAHDYQGKNEADEPVYQHLSPYPIIDFVGTVKVHGTNAGILKYKDRIEFQSRERVLSLESDNAHFMLNVSCKDLDWMFDGIEFDEYVGIYGEWAGQSIQAGVGVSQLPKMFIIFACNVDGKWVDYDRSKPEDRIFNVNDFWKQCVSIDFTEPEKIQNTLIELTEAVENECPVAKAFGVSGVGEGMVWASKDRQYVFKVKGEKHSATKVKTLASIDVEMIDSINEFVDNALTESRLRQGIDKLVEMGHEVSQKSTGEYLRWIVGDIMKEEADTIVANQFDPKKMNPIISKKAREWFFNNF